MVVFGFTSFTLRMVLLQKPAPPSAKSSLSTEVITQCLSSINFTDSAIHSGSISSGGRGFPVFTPQNLQLRVQMSPRIMKVAVPRFQHSPIFGQFPLVHMVCRPCLFT